MTNEGFLLGMIALIWIGVISLFQLSPLNKLVLLIPVILIIGYLGVGYDYFKEKKKDG